jgi:hypothetical protein
MGIGCGGLAGVLVVGLCGEEGQPHGEFQAVAPNVTVVVAASGGFATNATVQMVSYHPAVLSLEFLIPHDHLVVQVATLTPPTKNLGFSNAIPLSGMNPFYQRRQRPARLKSNSPLLTQSRKFDPWLSRRKV